MPNDIEESKYSVIREHVLKTTEKVSRNLRVEVDFKKEIIIKSGLDNESCSITYEDNSLVPSWLYSICHDDYGIWISFEVPVSYVFIVNIVGDRVIRK